MKQLLLFAALFSTLSLSAQDTLFTNVYENNDFGSTKPVTATVTSDGGLITVSKIIGFNGDVVFLSIQSDGSILWEKRYTGTTAQGLFVNDLITASDSSYIASGLIMNNGGNFFPFCMKVDETGTVLWSKSFDFATPIAGNYDILLEANPYVYEAADSSILMAWHHSTYMSSGTMPDHLCVAKLTSNGDLVWENSMAVDSTFYVSDIVENFDQSIFVLGNTNDDQTQTGSAYIVHLTDVGLFDWAKRFDGIELDEIITDSLGFATSWMNWNQQESGLMRFNSLGVNTRRVGSVQWVYESTPSFDKRENGHYFFSQRGDNFSGGIFFEVSQSLDLIRAEKALMIIQTIRSIPNYGMYAVGYGPIYGVKTTDNEIGVLRFDSLMNTNGWCSWPEITTLDEYPVIDGQAVNFVSGDAISLTPIVIQEFLTSSTATEGCVTYFGSVSEIQGSWNETVSPNPSSGAFTIDWSEYREAEIVVYNSVGQAIYRTSVNHSLVVVDLSKEVEGVYFYQLTDSDGKQSSGKLVVMD